MQCSSVAARLALIPTVPRRSTITSYYLCEKAESSAGRSHATSLSNALQQRLFIPYGVFSAANDYEESLTYYTSQHVLTFLLNVCFKYYVFVRVSRSADWRDYAAKSGPRVFCDGIMDEVQTHSHLQAAQDKRFAEHRHRPRANSSEYLSFHLLTDY